MRRIGIAAVLLFSLAAGLHAAAAPSPQLSGENFSSFSAVMGAIKPPVISNPEWLVSQLEAEEQQSAGPRLITYDVAVRGTVRGDFAEFKTLAYQTLNDSRGWSRAGIMFREVPSGGAFTLVLAEASSLPTFSAGCSSEYSCRAGRFVIINDDRWMGATPSWNNAGGSLRDYRHMVVNHETGHWLGHGHTACGSPGSPAAVMQQQSISLAGCSFNPWPLASELWVGV